WLQTRSPGQSVTLSLLRADKALELTVTLAATSRPLNASAERAYLGIRSAEAKEGEGVRVDQVAPESPAAAAGFKSGDTIVKIDGAEVTRASRLEDILAQKRPGDQLVFAVRRDAEEIVLKARLDLERGGGGGRRGGGGGR